MRATTVLVASACLEAVLAFPRFGLEGLSKSTRDANAPLDSDKIQRRQVAGLPPVTGFNPAAQYVSTHGEYEFVAPGPLDARGPCPGLNAMANHGYIPHNGVANIPQFIQGTLAVFGMAEDLSGFLAVYGSIFDGDLTAWSIGGPTVNLPVISGLLGTPQGMSGSHNKYENDASPVRGDLYLYGNGYKSQVPLFEQFYNMQAGVPDDQVNYDIDVIKEFRKSRFDNSIATNPYFFNGPFSGVIASPAAYSFIYRFMANKSEEYPEGRLDRNTLKTFYAMTGEPGSFKYTAGHERIPENWYKRAIGDEYTIPYFFEDAFTQSVYYPEFLSLGGNLGKTNSFTGLDIENLTGGVWNLAKLLSDPHAAACFGFELGLDSAPDLLEGIFTSITPAMSKLTKAFHKASKGLGCPQVEKKKYGQFKKYQRFPGYSKSYDGYTGL